VQCRELQRTSDRTTSTPTQPVSLPGGTVLQWAAGRKRPGHALGEIDYAYAFKYLGHGRDQSSQPNTSSNKPRIADHERSSARLLYARPGIARLSVPGSVKPCAALP
jgi:hypothetical protein